MRKRASGSKGLVEHAVAQAADPAPVDVDEEGLPVLAELLVPGPALEAAQTGDRNAYDTLLRELPLLTAAFTESVTRLSRDGSTDDVNDPYGW